MRRPLRQLFALLFTLVLLGAACSSPDSEDSATSDAADGDSFEEVGAAVEDQSLEMEAEAPATTIAAQADADRAADEAPAEPGGESSLGAGATPIALDTADIGRDIIRTATIEIEVEDVAESSQEALTAIEGVGGLLFNQSTTTNGTPRTVLTFKVRPADFSEAIRRLSDVGVLRDQFITADDVTERVVDIESRIITAEASVNRLREFLDGAQTLEAIAQLESELLRRETDLEVLRGQLRTIQNQVSLATITVGLTQTQPGPAMELLATAYLGHDNGATCGGTPELEVDEGVALTLCYELSNTGDTHLGSIEVRDDHFDVDARDLIVQRGSLDTPLAPGETITLYTEIEASYGGTGVGQASAVPVDSEGNDLRLATTAARDGAQLRVIEDTSIPGFGSGVSAGWQILTQIVAVVVLLAGLALPFIWVPVLLWFAARWLRRRKAEKLANMPTPPPPATPPAPTTSAAPTPPQPPAEAVSVAGSSSSAGPDA